MKETNKEKINEFIRYLIIGFSTTLLNWLSAIFFEEVLGMVEWLGTALSWIISVVLFAFWAYKFFVFRSRSMEKKVLVPEFIGFTSARLLTLGFETGFIFVFVNLLGFNQVLHFGFTRMIDGVAGGQFGISIKEYYIFKFIATVFVTIMNYIASKLVIFRNAKKNEAESDEGESK
ncbi:MAG: GtrA family protein [Clostridia bacterium]|nr:GtrA family protein [Clostridia bacterium]